MDEAGLDDYIGNIQLRLDTLDSKHKECTKNCSMLAKQIKELTDFKTKKTVEGVTLGIKSTLIDLLVERILDVSADWKEKIDLLINIPHGTEGKDFLRGGDYFEALFQLAIAIGCLPQFKGKDIIFKDIKKYVSEVDDKNYLYTKTVHNSGGGEQGVSDITFEVRTPGSDSPTSSTDYKCGEIPNATEAATENPTYFISVKGYKKEGNAAKKYDIPLIHHQISILPHIKNKHILVCVRNKEEFIKRLGRTRMGFIRSSVNFVIGYSEVMDAFTQFRSNFFVRMGNTEINTAAIRQNVELLFPKQDEPLKPMMSLYFHQELVSNSVLRRINEIGTPTKPHFMCIGVLPRGGKSYIAGGIIREHMKKKTTGYNVLFVTSAVNETREQFQADLVNKFSDFDSFDFVDVVNDKNKSGNKPNKFIFASRQLVTLSDEKVLPENDESESSIAKVDIYSKLQQAFGGTPPSFDICFFDEAHIGINSETVMNQFHSAFEKFKIPIVLMTATYKNPAAVLESKNDLFVWDLQDVKDMKDLPTLKIDKFAEGSPEFSTDNRYGNYALDLLRRRISYGETEEQIARPYVYFPVPNFISLTFKPEVLKQFIDSGSGYTFKKAFELNKDRSELNDHTKYTSWGKMLSNREDAMRLRQFLTPEVEEGAEEILINEDRKFRALNQVFRIAQRTGSRPVAGTPFSMLMFLPVNEKAIPIGDICRIWGSFMLESKYWRDNFVFLTLSKYIPQKVKKGTSNIRNEPTTKKDWEKAINRGLFHREDFKTSLKETIQIIERKALEYGKGLVLLSGNVAKMGISLKCVDVVCMMNTNKDADDIIQKMYRALTDDPPTKKNGFIIDLDIKRIVTAMFEYDIRRRPLSRVGDENEVKERLDSIMELCNWGQDAYMEDNNTNTFDDVMNDVRNLVFGDLSTTLHTAEMKKVKDVVVEKQVDLILKDSETKRMVSAALRNTSMTKDAAPSRETVTMMERGETVPGEESSAPPQEPAPSREENPLTDEEIRKKLSDIVQTFINSLVIKSSKNWDDTMTFSGLISKYKSDKESATKSCSCNTNYGFTNEYADEIRKRIKKGETVDAIAGEEGVDTDIIEAIVNNENECTGKTSNFYDIVYCELRGYAFTKKGQYSIGMHNSIMNMLDEIFEHPEQIVPDWKEYIGSFINELKAKSVVGAGKPTRKKASSMLNNGRRTKRKNHTGHYRKKTDSG